MEPTNRCHAAQLDYFFSLPSDIMGNVLDQLNRETGTKEVVNQADIPVVLKSVRNLLYASKGLAKKLSEPSIIKVFLDSLSKRFGHPSAHFAALLNITGFHQPWTLVKDNGDEEAYLAIQYIHQLASQVLQEAKKKELDFTFEAIPPLPNFDDDQTLSGLFLYNGCGPKYLATPFGKITIFGNGTCSGHADISVSEIFIERLNARFEGFNSKNSKKDTCVIFSPSNFSNKIRKINPEDLKQIDREKLEESRGTSTLIRNCSAYTIYKITQVNGKSMPDAAWYPSSQSKRSSELMQVIWEVLEKKHSKKILQISQIKKKENLEKFTDDTPLFNNLSEIALWAIDLIKQLADHPLFPGVGWSNIPSRILPLKSYRDASFVELLNQSAQKLLTAETSWRIRAFGVGNYCLHLDKKDIGPGLLLFVDNDKQCSLDTLFQACQSVVDNIGFNWQRKCFKEYPYISYTQSEEEYVLCIKEKRLFEKEPYLLTEFARQLGISYFIRCSDKWKKPFSNDNKPLYLWIRKDKLEKVITLLKLPKSCLAYTPNKQN